jgi:hypothetical protein
VSLPDKHIGVFTTTNEEDAVRWGDQYLAETFRMGLPFFVYFDRCSPSSKERFIRHPCCKGYLSQDDPRTEYAENHKQGVMDLAAAQGYRWAMSWDVDETWERDAPEKLRRMMASVPPDHPVCDVSWLCLWDDPKFIRTDPPVGGRRRERLYDLMAGTWYFVGPIVYGPYLHDVRNPGRHYAIHKLDLVCLHWGYMTRELRELHKRRWDRVYGAAVGKNPYELWDYMLRTEEFPPQLEEHGLLP